VHPGVRLTSVDIDYRTTCRHAAQLFLANGHRRLAFLKLNSRLAGDVESEEGFLAGARSVHRHAAEALVCNHKGTVSHICQKLDDLLACPGRPTALLVSHAPMC